MIAHHNAEKGAEQQAQSEQPAEDVQPAAAPPPEAPSPPAEPSMDQKIHEIDELAKLRDSGALTEEEFAQQKQRILYT